ncbi:MAG: ShlB/FhaC/HecB family hemolysin secretion/activation protein [bacterium]
MRILKVDNSLNELNGRDPNQYFEKAGGRAELVVRPWRDLDLRVGVQREDHTSLPVNSSWNLFGYRDNVSDNLPCDELQTKALTVGVGFSWRRWRLDADLQLHRVFGGSYLDARNDLATGQPVTNHDFRRLQLSLSGSILDRHGNEYRLKGHWISLDQQAPLQWKTYLGNYQNLRGFDVRSAVGDQAGWASLDIHWGFDLFRAVRFPLLGKLGLQPITFFDYGRAFALDGPFEQEWDDGWRADAGFGFGKMIGVPGYKGNLRLYLGRPVLMGPGDDIWHLLIAFEN